jgi:hypothetical protein
MARGLASLILSVQLLVASPSFAFAGRKVFLRQRVNGEAPMLLAPRRDGQQPILQVVLRRLSGGTSTRIVIRPKDEHVEFERHEDAGSPLTGIIERHEESRPLGDDNLFVALQQTVEKKRLISVAFSRAHLPPQKKEERLYSASLVLEEGAYGGLLNENLRPGRGVSTSRRERIGLLDEVLYMRPESKSTFENGIRAYQHAIVDRFGGSITFTEAFGAMAASSMAIGETLNVPIVEAQLDFLVSYEE